MKIKNINIGDFIEAKNKNGGDISYDVLEVGKSYKVLGFSEVSDLTVIISVPDHKLFSDGFYVCHECFRKPKPQLKTLDQSVFDWLDEKWRFAAVDADGSVRAYNYTQTPTDGNHEPHPDQDNANYKFIGTGYDASNWQNSLIERDKVELTGSDLCRAMLERGDRFVMCMVDDGVDVIHDLACFVSSTHPYIGRLDNYKAVTPTNNQGEPLTQSEAGL